MTTAHSAMHHDPTSAQLAVATYEADLRRAHDQQQHRQLQLYAIGRMFLSALFIASAAAKLADYRGTLQALENSLADASWLLPIALAIELIGGLFLFAGYRARAVSVALLAYLGTVTLLMHHDLTQPLNRSFALANMAFAGALLMVAAHGAGSISVDRWLQRRKG